MGTVYLLCPEATISPLHRAAVKSANDKLSAISNVLIYYDSAKFDAVVTRAKR